MALKSTYNFAPLNEKVFCPEWKGDVSQDIPFENGEDGTITFNITNVSPLYVRDKDKNDPKPAHIKIGDKYRFFIPATSIKGMLRSVMEVFTFARMTQNPDNNEKFSYRNIRRQDYRTAAGEVECGWLYKDKQDGKYKVDLCCEQFEKILIEALPKRPVGDSSYDRNKSLGWYPEYNSGREKYNIVCTGKMRNKRHEYLFPTETYEPDVLDDKFMAEFKRTYKNTDGFEEYMARLEKYERIAVFVILDKDGYIKHIGNPRYMRLPYKNSINDLISKQQPATSGLDLCQMIFGYADLNGKSLRGRVQITPAFTAPLGQDVIGAEIKGVLGQPKPSYYPLYLKQVRNGRNRYKTYNDADGIAGRKFYRIHSGSGAKSLPQNDGNEDVITSFKPLKPNQKFTCKINVHNMRPIEIGALLSALTLHQTPNVFHNIGLAKGFGYGKIKIKDVNLKGLSMKVEDYLAAFEEEMCYFLGADWTKCEQVTTLLQILSDHNTPDLGMMSLPEFGRFTQDNNFDTLVERAQVNCPSFIKS